MKVVVCVIFDNPSSNTFQILFEILSYVQSCQTIRALQMQKVLERILRNVFLQAEERLRGFPLFRLDMACFPSHLGSKE